MKKENYNGHTLELFDSIDELPIFRYQKFNQFLLMDSGIGSDASEVSAKTQRIGAYIANGQKELALQELANMQQALIFTIENISPRMFAFVCLLNKIDGEEVTDLTEGGIKSTLEKLNKTRVSISFINKLIDAFKKKVQANSKRFSLN